MIPEESKKLNKVLLIASCLNIIGLICVLFSFLKLTPITLMLSTGAGGFLIALSLFLYLSVVIQDLRRRKVL